MDKRGDIMGTAQGRHRKGPPPPPLTVFATRIGRSLVVAAGIVGPALGVGMAGYRFFEGWSWLDCFLNASMILSGMGPANEVKTAGGKVFAGCYALVSGLVILSVAAVVLAPVLHRVMHRLHWELGKDGSEEE